MRNVKMTIWVMMLVCLFGAGQAAADLKYDMGGEWDVDFYVDDYLYITDNLTGDPTTVNLLDNGCIVGVHLYDNSEFNMFGGALRSGALYTYENSTAYICGGLVVGVLSIHRDSRLTISGTGFNYPYGTYTNTGGILTGTLADGSLIDTSFHIYDNATLTLVPEPATPPVADAGSNQTVTDTDGNGSEQVTLNGSGSSDSDGTIVSWVWADDLGDVIPDGESPTATLSVGTHTITLTVTDDDDLTNTDTVAITVYPYSAPPVADTGTDVIADANQMVVLSASASYDPDGHIAQYTWTALPENEILYSGEESTFTTRALGRVEEVIKLTVTDNQGASSEDTVSIFNRRVEEIELTPGPAGSQGPQGIQGPPGITPAEIAQLQAQIAALQQIVEENRLAMEQFMPLKKLLEELGSPEGIPGDVNNDGKVDQADLAILSSHWLEGTQ